jgi:hypothetical protein
MARLRDEGLLPPSGAAKVADHLAAARAGAELVAQKARDLIDDDAVGILRQDEVLRLARSVIDRRGCPASRKRRTKASATEC